MKQLEKSRKVWFFTALATSVSGVAGIPGIIFGAIYGVWWLMALSIALMVHAFYGSVFYWMAFTERIFLNRLLHTVRDDGLLTVADISRQLGKPIAEIRRGIIKCLAHGWLSGYRFDGETLSVIVRAEAPKPKTAVCPSCGATVALTGDCRCEYCGGVISK